MNYPFVGFILIYRQCEIIEAKVAHHLFGWNALNFVELFVDFGRTSELLLQVHLAIGALNFIFIFC